MSTWLIALAAVLAWLGFARVSYWTLVRHDWLHAMTSRGEYILEDLRQCPNWASLSHPTHGRCSTCSQRKTVEDDWAGTRANRILMSVFLGPFVVLSAAVRFAVGAGQPVQREERDDRLKKAEAALEAANRELDKIKEER